MLSDADAIKNRWECKHRNFQTSLSPPDNLYHYTDAHGLHGIAFEPVQLWLTDYRSTNDPTEGKYVRTLLAESYGKHFKSGYSDLLDAPLHPDSSDSSHNFARDFYESLRPRLFASFSQSDDELSQWVHYGSNGFGYCIGMKSASLLGEAITLSAGQYSPIFNRDDVVIEPKLVRVEYDRRRQEVMCDEISADVAAFFAKHIEVLYPYSPALIRLKAKVRSLLDNFAVMFSFDFKHPAYSSEREWRYLIDPPGEAGLVLSNAIRSRVRGSQIAWYLPINCSITSIRSGPKADFSQLRVAFSHQLRRRQSPVELLKSSIPLR